MGLPIRGGFGDIHIWQSHGAFGFWDVQEEMCQAGLLAMNSLKIRHSIEAEADEISSSVMEASSG